ncbi:MAG: sn-glycerol-3-phosphate transporter [Gammaproteobacteria bacterium]|nr:sn-glycerol-3-phosphate transporter [Gammaproteobacteria bacterium]
MFAFALALLAAFSCARAADGMSWLQPLTDSEVDHRSFYSSLLTRHYDPEPDHNNDQNLLGYETHFQNRYLWGFAMFDNSFGQESQYAYLGRKYRAFESDRWYYKITGGMLHGYKEPYEDKIPFNEFGIAPAVIPSIGYQYKGFNAEFVQLGLSAGMITLGLSF